MADRAATRDLAAGPFPPALRRSIGVIMIGSALSFLDSTIVNVALRSLSVSLHAPLAQVQWVVTGYLLALAAVIPSPAGPPGGPGRRGCTSRRWRCSRSGRLCAPYRAAPGC